MLKMARLSTRPLLEIGITAIGDDETFSKIFGVKIRTSMAASFSFYFSYS
jgi:hypothetical protein